MSGEEKKKKLLRKEIKEVLNKYSVSDLKERSSIIQSHFFSLPEYQKLSLPMSYVSTGREVYTHDLIKKVIADKNAVAVPFIAGNEIIPCKIGNFEDLERGVFGILQPTTEADSMPLSALDMIIVPGLAFDRQGNRLGRGKGFYDRFLQSVNPKTLKIALAFSFQIVKRVPITANDVSVDKVITENGIIECKNSG